MRVDERERFDGRVVEVGIWRSAGVKVVSEEKLWVVTTRAHGLTDERRSDDHLRKSKCVPGTVSAVNSDMSRRTHRKRKEHAPKLHTG